MTNNKYLLNKRRGLSSIVGGMIFVVLMISAFAVIGVSLNAQTDISSTGRDVAATDLKKSLEDFRIDVSTDDSDPAELFIQVKNNGQNPVEISTVVVAEITKRLENYPVETYDIPTDLSLIPPGKEQQILPAATAFLDLADPLVTGLDKELYTIKVISNLGTIKTWTIECDDTACGETAPPAGAGSLSATLFLDGPNGVNSKTSTVVMFVTNTSDTPVYNVSPINGVDGDPSCSDFWVSDVSGVTVDDGIVERIEDCVVSPNPPVDLGPHEVTIFKWDFTVYGDIGAEFEFCNRAHGDDLLTPDPPGVLSQHGICTLVGEEGAHDSLTVIDPNDCQGCNSGQGGETIILIDDLLIRPSIFMVIPSPFGDSLDDADEKGVWGINVANPTDKDMEITKVTIVAYPPGGQSQDTVFSGLDAINQACLEEDIEPNMGPQPGGYWDCPRDNILVWEGLNDPINLKANSTRSFLVKVEPADIKTGPTQANLDALIVQANVWSEFGSFGKSGYQATMYLEKTSIVNVYLSNSTTSRDSIIGYYNDIPELTNQNFKAVFADMDNDPATVVNTGARFIINIPREWTFAGFNEDPIPGFVNPPTVTVHSDGSTQIIAQTSVPLGDGVNDALGIDFNAIAPDIKSPRLYVMYILADGTVTVAGEQKTIGPLNEVVLNVDPIP